MDLKAVSDISHRLSLRPPQADSLELLAQLVAPFSFSEKSARPELAGALAHVQGLAATCRDFERDFPSVAFALATGVGKTRLMGAFISYLFREKGVKNFFVLAPNLTIYNKLMDDFGKPSHPKYVFRGIHEFAVQPPVVITGDNYREVGQQKLFEESVHINVFNIAKINAESRAGAVPKIRKMSEILGQSYFDYLKNLPDLVILMDESHHYRAAAGMKVINELMPALGLELTATPVAPSGEKFKNVVFEYPLSAALRDGFVKEPRVATRADFNPDQYSRDPLELDRVKLADAVKLHEDTRTGLEIYARENGLPVVKPFILVVCRDTSHAAEIKNMVQTEGFANGYYRDKAIEVHSNQKGSEKDENIQLLTSLEHPLNKIEIVIHVNMLKEGWDVTNLYTIVPLRAAASEILVEQTIGRGLRMPYGGRTGNKMVDSLNLVAHDRFDAVVEAANRPGSIINKGNIILLEGEPGVFERKETVASPTVMGENHRQQRLELEKIADPVARAAAENNLTAQELVLENLPKVAHLTKNLGELTHAEVKKAAIEQVRQAVLHSPQQNLFAEELIKAAELVYDKVVEDFTKNTIPIPRITVQPTAEVRSGFRDFDLETRTLSFQPLDHKIKLQTLRTGEVEIIAADDSRVRRDTPQNMLVTALMNIPEVDYGRDAALLHKLSGQAIAKFETYAPGEKAIQNIVVNNRAAISGFIKAQMMPHFFVENPNFEEPMLEVRNFSKIIDHFYSRSVAEKIHGYRETIEPTSRIKSLIFGGFAKSAHLTYKFDSKTEKDFAIMLEDDGEALRWMRPAPNQFYIYYQQNSRQYRPDFVVEMADRIYLVETKRADETEAANVVEKAHAAREYCRWATIYNQQNGGKPWEYVIVPHNEVQFSATVGRVLNQNLAVEAA